MLRLFLGLQYVICDKGKYYCYSCHNCIYSWDCAKRDLFAYTVAKVCIDTYKPDESSGPPKATDGSYSCPSGKTTVFNSSVVKCVEPEEGCGDPYVSKFGTVCVDTASACSEFLKGDAYNGPEKNECILDCIDRDGYLYNNQCLTAVQCTALNRRPYICGT